MTPRVKVLTRVVDDLEPSLAFYDDGLGPKTYLQQWQGVDDAVVCFNLDDDMILALTQSIGSAAARAGASPVLGDQCRGDEAADKQQTERHDQKVVEATDDRREIGHEVDRADRVAGNDGGDGADIPGSSRISGRTEQSRDFRRTALSESLGREATGRSGAAGSPVSSRRMPRAPDSATAISNSVHQSAEHHRPLAEGLPCRSQDFGGGRRCEGKAPPGVGAHPRVKAPGLAAGEMDEGGTPERAAPLPGELPRPQRTRRLPGTVAFHAGSSSRTLSARSALRTHWSPQIKRGNFAWISVSAFARKSMPRRRSRSMSRTPELK